jgi:cytosine/adenosine deaminase-related metal-dependent hydrolase
MSYRKFKADYLFDGYKMLREDAVLICRQDGTVEEIIVESQAGGDLEKFSGIITPGFINCHCHLELSHLKGAIPEKQGLVNFVLSVISQRNQPEDFILAAIGSAEAGMMATGIVAVGDICNTSYTAISKSANRLEYYNFIELFGWAPEQAVSRFESGKKLADYFIETGMDEKYQSLNPHAPYSVSRELWDLMKPGFSGKTITIHNQESAAENEFFMTGSGDLARMYSLMKMDILHFNAPGTKSLPYYLQRLKDASAILLVHNTFMDEADMLQALDFSNDLFFCLCPNANRYIEDRLPDIPLFQKNKTRLVLGTDSLASNHQLSILEEMKTIKNTFPLTPTAQMLLWATSNGARALAFEEKLGDFTKGKKPGIVLIEKIKAGEIGAASTSRRIL